MKNDAHLFLELELKEIRNRVLSSSNESKLSFKIWKDIDHFYHAELESFSDDVFIMHELEILPHEDNYYFVSFSMAGLSYYMKCVVSAPKTLSVLGNIFRAERRKDVRIVMHPRFDAYVYFLMNLEDEVESHDNVLSFNKADNEENSLIKNFQKEISRDIELNGEKILDMSYTGLSLICNEEHYKILSDQLPKRANIIIKGRSVIVENLSIVYNVDYIDFRFESIKMKKVGLSFDENEELSKIVKEYDDESLTLTSLDKEFQTFVETE